MIRLLLQFIGIAGIALLVLFFLTEADLETSRTLYTRNNAPVLSQTAAPSVTFPETEAPEEALPEEPTPKEEAPAPIPEETPQAAPENKPIPEVESWYSSAPLSIDALNTSARASLVNILCKTSNTMLRPISGSGVIIDARGVVMTNAHVAQYVLLASSGMVDLSCTIRTGSPARGAWTADVLYMPSAWVAEHASDIRKTRPLGTGEHDYAFLFITGTEDGSALPSTFPYLPVETRSTSRVGDGVFLAAYPAEFSGGSATQNALSASSAATTIKELLTFHESTIDLISFGGVVVAQSGSSGGAALNAWGFLTGIISTTSEGETTADRDLRAITTSYVNRSLNAATGYNLAEFLGKDVAAETRSFMQGQGKTLAQLLVDQILAN